MRIKLSHYVYLITIVVFMVLSLFFALEMKETFIDALKTCIYSVIPSLFVMCVLSSAAAQSGIIERMMMGTGIDANVFCAFLFGNLGGYPVGAKMLSDLVKSEKISYETAEKAICFSYASGPGFCLGMVSSMVFKNNLLGMAAFVSAFLANLTLYLFYAVKNKRTPVRSCTEAVPSLTECMTSSVQSSAQAMISVGATIVFFSVMMAAIGILVPKFSECSILKSICEISNVSKLEYKGIVSFSYISAILSFGGICVHMQIKSIVGNSFSLSWFYKTRPLQIGLTFLYSLLLYKVLNVCNAVSATPDVIFVPKTHSLIPFICVMAMIAIAIAHNRKTIK